MICSYTDDVVFTGSMVWLTVAVSLITTYHTGDWSTLKMIRRWADKNWHCKGLVLYYRS